ncbi:epithelial-stromal interaction protein 1 [Erethizon dorsatum]
MSLNFNPELLNQKLLSFNKSALLVMHDKGEGLLVWMIGKPLLQTGAYTMIAPNETRRHQIQRIAEQELASLEKWKEQNRAKPVHLLPRRLGGSQSESEVRQKQQLQLMQSKYQQKLKREEYVRIKKEAEEAELQKMKAIQREKSNKLEEKKLLQEKLRRETFREHHQYKTAEFLSRMDRTPLRRSTCQFAPHVPQSSTWKCKGEGTGKSKGKASHRDPEPPHLEPLRSVYRTLCNPFSLNVAFLPLLPSVPGVSGLIFRSMHFRFPIGVGKMST